MLGKRRADTAQRAAQLRQQLAMGAKELWKAVHACEQMRKVPILCFQDLRQREARSKRTLPSLAFRCSQDLNRLGGDQGS